MIIISNKPGQLGNRLFIFASFMAFAKEFNLIIRNPAFNDYASFFEKTVLYACRFPFAKKKNRFSLLNSYSFAYFFARILHRLKISNKLFSYIYLDWEDEFDLIEQAANPCFKSKYVFVQGWLFRSDELFAKHQVMIREYFRPVEKISNSFSNIITKIRQDGVLLIGVHIRHGDYKDFENGKYFYSTEVYYKLMQQIVLMFASKQVKFLICSDEEQQEKDFPGLEITISHEHFITDMYLLASCDYIAGPPSTFSMWASFYGDVPLYMIKDPGSVPQKEDFIKYGDRSGG